METWILGALGGGVATEVDFLESGGGGMLAECCVGWVYYWEKLRWRETRTTICDWRTHGGFGSGVANLDCE